MWQLNARVVSEMCVRAGGGPPPTTQLKMLRLVAAACVLAPAFAAENPNDPFGGFTAYESYDVACADDR